MNEEFVVIKVGGSCLSRHRESVAGQVSSLVGKRPFVLVHGYGPELRDLLSTLGIERPAFISASGVPSHQTTEEIAELSALAACRVREILAAQFKDAGITAKAIPASWNGFVTGARKGRIRYVDDGVVRVRQGDFAGKVSQVNIDRLAELRQEHRCFIVSAILRGSRQETLVIDADRLAIEIASALNAPSLYILSDQPGVLVNGATVPDVKLNDIAQLEPHATGGMSRKLKHIKTGLQSGIGKIFLLDGASPLLNGAPHGTVFTRS
jgi:acetylglutamate kinase